MTESPATRDFDCDSIWKFWIDQLPVWPELCRCVLSCLSVPTSSAIVERSFKENGKVGFNKDRGALKGDKAGELMKVYYNRRLRLEDVFPDEYFTF